MALDNTTQAKYLQRPIVKQRNSVTLIGWSGYTAALPIPATPDDAWIRERIVAENLPLQVDYTTQQTLSYFLQDPQTQTDILKFISEDNDDATEITLSQENQDIVGAFMPRYAQTTVSDQQVTDWRARNGVPPAKGGKA